MPGDNDSARRVRPRDTLSASETNAALDRAMREHVAPEMHADGIGTYFTFPPSRPLSYYHRWGKLDGNLKVGGTATVSLWQATGGGWHGWDEDSGENIEAYAPPVQSSTIASGAWVRVFRAGSVWVVDMAACQEEEASV